MSVADGAGSSINSSTEPMVWTIRAGSGAVHAGQFLVQGRAGIGFGVKTSIAGLGWDEITALAKEAMPGQPSVTVGLATGALYRVVTEIRNGDIVLTPEPNSLGEGLGGNVSHVTTDVGDPRTPSL